MVEFKTVARTPQVMKNSKYLIIGDGVAGDSAAQAITEQNEEADVSILTADSEPLYNRITLKSYMKGKMPKKFTKIHQIDWYNNRGINLELNTRVVDVDTEDKTVRTEKGDIYGYERLLVATGGKKKYLPEDQGFNNFHYMWDWNDADRIKESAEENDKAVVIGGGLLGIDLAVIYAEHGFNVDYLIRGGHWWRKGMSKPGAKIIHQKLEDKGINLVNNCSVEEVVSENGEAKKVIGSNGESYSCDVVGVAIGRHSNSDFIDAEKTEEGCIKTDQFLETSEQDVLAAGDMVNYYSPMFEKRREGGTWDHSAAMGQRAGKNLAGDEDEFYFVPSYGVGHFDVQLLSLGENHGESVFRREEDRYMELSFEEDRLVGAVLIKDVSAEDEIEKAIEEKKVFDNHEDAIDRFW